MKATSIPRNLTNCFSEQQLLISNHQKSLEDFIEKPFSKEAFSSQIELKSKNYLHSNRKLLQSVLIPKYIELENNAQAIENIQKLTEENCFTITTGHQLSLLSGPIYFIYKILHVIKQCEELKKIHPNYHFVPVFWMASEDHDFEEIKTISIFGKSLNWETKQTGAVGRMNLAELQKTLDDFKQLFNNTSSNEIFDLINKMDGKTYGEAFFNFIHAMFSEFGLVIIDGDQKEFKKSFGSIMQLEIETKFSHKAVIQTSEKLSKSNYKIQVNPREINLFYLSEKRRERILPIGSNFGIGEKLFTKKEILDLIEIKTESFSPNVILRPLYQEFLLPNLCYVGGTNELNYWLQLKQVFESAGILYPLIQARTSALWIDNSSIEKIKKFNLNCMTQSFDFAQAPGHLIRRAHQIAVALFMTELSGEDVTPVQFAMKTRGFRPHTISLELSMLSSTSEAGEAGSSTETAEPIADAADRPVVEEAKTAVPAGKRKALTRVKRSAAHKHTLVCVLLV
jgi:bacillithiol biosynthesis cysteine-adding enzyme BshC